MPESEKDLIAYCGLGCMDCFGHQGKIADLSRDLRKELRKARFENQAKLMSAEPYFAVFKDYDKCYQVLGALVKFRCKSACRGGGPPFCKIRNCCHKKAIDGCWQCDYFETCDKLAFLEPFHADAHLKNIRKIRKFGIDGFLEGKRFW